MTEQITTVESPVKEAPANQINWLQLSAAAFLGFGVAMFVLINAYARDLELLRQVPEAVWLFVCGVPLSSPQMPALLIGLDVIALAVGGLLLLINKLRSAR